MSSITGATEKATLRRAVIKFFTPDVTVSAPLSNDSFVKIN